MVGVHEQADAELDEAARDAVQHEADNVRHNGDLDLALEKLQQRIQDHGDDHDGCAVHRERVEPIAPEHRVRGIVFALHPTHDDELAKPGFHPVAQHREDDEVHDEIADERPSLAGYRELVLLDNALVLGKVVDHGGLHALRQQEVQEEEGVVEHEPQNRERVERIRGQPVYRRQQDADRRSDQNEGPRDLVAVDEEPERHALQNDHDPADDAGRVIGNGIA